MSADLVIRGGTVVDGTGAPRRPADVAVTDGIISEIGPRLDDYRNTHANVARVLIRGDRLAKFGPAMMVLDEVRRAGISQVSVETVTSQTGK